MQPCKLIMTTASNTANLQFLGITKASCHGHINIITVFHSTNFKFAGVYCWSSCGKKTQLKFLQKFVNCPKRWCIFFLRKGSIEFPKQMQIIIHVLFATHIKLEKWKKKKDFLIFLVNVLLLDCLESISLALHESTFIMCFDRIKWMVLVGSNNSEQWDLMTEVKFPESFFSWWLLPSFSQVIQGWYCN